MLNRIVWALNSDVQLSPGIVNGEIIGSHNIQLTSGADVVGVPGPSSVVLVIIGSLTAAALTARRKLLF